jgi:hypothetical protein
MPQAEFDDLMTGSKMFEGMRRAVGRVLVEGWPVTAAAEKIGEPPSVVHRACRTVLARRRVDGELQGPAGAFEKWYAARCVPAPPTVNPRGLKVLAWSDGPDLRADLAEWEPDVEVSRVEFGTFMAAKGHRGSVHRGVTRYPGVRLVDGVATPMRKRDGPKKPAPERYNGHPLRRPDGGRWVDPRTGEEIPDSAIRAYFDALDDAEENAPVIDPATGRVLGTRVSLGMVKGRASKAGEL